MWPLRASPAHFQPSQPQDKDRADGERLAMSPSLPILLGQVLCLGQVILTQEGALPRPSISAEPGAVILWGQPVTIVCRGPAEAETFRLAWEDGSNYTDQKILPQRPPHETEARFPITRVSDDTARHYYCRYHKNSSWSEHSEFLELVVTGEDVSALPSGLSPCPWTLSPGVSSVPRLSCPPVDPPSPFLPLQLSVFSPFSLYSSVTQTSHGSDAQCPGVAPNILGVS
uniref:Ig-like domain-containing protein n=2 Tax=Equus caballus TaxID=9796 RepID=A0A9L0R4Z5_HORSE